MRQLLAAAFAAVMFPAIVCPALAQMPPVIAYSSPLTPLGYQQLTSLGTAVTLTIPKDASGVPAGAALIECDSAAGIGVRYRDDGTAPTATVGMELLPGAATPYVGDLSKLQFIQVSATAKLNVLYYAH